MGADLHSRTLGSIAPTSRSSGIDINAPDVRVNLVLVLAKRVRHNKRVKIITRLHKAKIALCWSDRSTDNLGVIILVQILSEVLP